MIKIAVLTISDTRTKETDETGKKIESLLSENKNFHIDVYEVVPDDKEKIKNKIIYYADHLNAEVILTNGGTGLSPRDVTPEATREVINIEVCGLSEYIRMQGAMKTKRALLSRGITGIRGKTLIVNLPGSPKGAVESLGVIMDVIPHAIDMMHGKGH